MVSSSTTLESDDDGRSCPSSRSPSPSLPTNDNNNPLSKILDVIEDGVLGPMSMSSSVRSSDGSCGDDEDTSTIMTFNSTNSSTANNSTSNDENNSTYTSFNTSLSDGENTVATVEKNGGEEHDDDDDEDGEDDWWNIMSPSSARVTSAAVSAAFADTFADTFGAPFGGSSAPFDEEEEEVSFEPAKPLPPSAQRTPPSSSILRGTTSTAEKTATAAAGTGTASAGAAAAAVSTSNSSKKKKNSKRRHNRRSRSFNKDKKKNKKSSDRKSVRFDVVDPANAATINTKDDDDEDSIFGDLETKKQTQSEETVETKDEEAATAKAKTKNNNKKRTKKNGILAFTRRRHKMMKNKNKNDNDNDKAAAVVVSPTDEVGADADTAGIDAGGAGGGAENKAVNSDEESYTTVTVFEYTNAVVVAAAAMFMASLLSLSSFGGVTPPNPLMSMSSFFCNKDKDKAYDDDSTPTDTNSRSNDDNGDDGDGDDDTVTTEANRLRWIRLWRDLLLLPPQTQTGSNDVGNEISSFTIPITKPTLMRRTSSISLSSGLLRQQATEVTSNDEQEDQERTVTGSDDSPTTTTTSSDDADYDWTPLWIAAATGLAATAAAATAAAQLSKAGDKDNDSDIDTEAQPKKTNESDETDETATSKMELSSPNEDDIDGLKDHQHHHQQQQREVATVVDKESSVFGNAAALTASAAAVAATGAFFLWSSRGAQESNTDESEGPVESVEDVQDETKVSTEDDADDEEEEQVPAVVQSIGSSGSEEDTATSPPPQPAASDKDGDIDVVEQDRGSGGTETVLSPSEQKNEKPVKKKKGSWNLWKKFVSTKQQKADRVALVSSNDETTSPSTELSYHPTNNNDETVMVEESSPLGDKIIVNTASIEVNNDEVDDDTPEIVHQFLAKAKLRKSNRKSKAKVAAIDRSNKATERTAVDDGPKMETKRRAYFEQYVEKDQPTDDDEDPPKRSSSSYTDLRTLDVDNSNTNILRSAVSWDEYSYDDYSQGGTVETTESCRSRGTKDSNRLRSDSEGSDDIELDDDASLVSVKPINIFKETTQEILKDVSFLYNREHHETFEDEDEEEIFGGLDDSLRTIDEGTIGSSSMDDRNLDSPIPFEMNDGRLLIQDANNNSIGNDDFALTLTLDESFSVVDDDESDDDAGAATRQDVSPHTTPTTKSRLSILSSFVKRSEKRLDDDGAVLQSAASDDREDVLETSLGASPGSSSPKRQPASPIYPFSSPSSKSHAITGGRAYGEESSPSQPHRRRLFIRNLSLRNRKSPSTPPAPTPVS